VFWEWVVEEIIVIEEVVEEEVIQEWTMEGAMERGVGHVRTLES
jgi:hypothetical protein